MSNERAIIWYDPDHRLKAVLLVALLFGYGAFVGAVLVALAWYLT